MKTFSTRSQDETYELGRLFARKLKAGDVIALYGNLGSGKTQFAKGVCEGLNVISSVGSPTFTLINEYQADASYVAHIDLYRIQHHHELRELGLEEYFGNQWICLIEWAETALHILPERRYDVKISYGAGDFDREIAIQEMGQGGR